MAKKNLKKKYALVTGAGTGLGFATTKLLSADGWTVFATKIPEQSDEELKKLRNVIPYTIDITKQESVDEIFKKVEAEVGDNGLAALVNVAGLAGVAGGIIEGVPEDRIRILMEVNLFGTLRMCRSFLPLLRKYGPGRIVNVSTSGIRVPTTFSGIYAISKYGVEGITNALRYELRPFGIQATSIEPGGMITPMTANSEENMKKTWEFMLPGIKDIYYDKISPSLSYMNSMMDGACPPEKVGKVIVKALHKKKMKIRYMGGNQVGMMPFLQRFFGENTFEKMVQKQAKLVPPKK